MFVVGLDEGLEFRAMGSFRKRPRLCFLLKSHGLQFGTFKLNLDLSSWCKKETEVMGSVGRRRNMDYGERGLKGWDNPGTGCRGSKSHI